MNDDRDAHSDGEGPRIRPVPPGYEPLPPISVSSDADTQPHPVADESSPHDNVADLGSAADSGYTNPLQSEPPDPTDSGLPRTRGGEATTTAPYGVVAVPPQVDIVAPAPPVSIVQQSPVETSQLRIAATPIGYGQQDSHRPRRGIPPLLFAVAIVAALVLGGGAAAWWTNRTDGNENSAAAETTVGTVPATSPTPSTNTEQTAITAGTTAAPIGSATTAAQTETTPVESVATVPGDLGLDEPMRRPACDGQFIVITANAVTPGVYPQEVAEARRTSIGAAYLRTDQTCSSLRPADDLGNAIYSVFYGPFPTLDQACQIRDQVGGESYVKILDQSTPHEKVWDC